MILSLVASVASNYLTLRGLDEQLVISKRTLGTYGESVRLYKLQFQYGQVSQMQVSQVQSQYETAAVQIPLIESQIAQTENSLSVLIGRNPGIDSPRQVDLRPRAAEGARGHAVGPADAAAGPAASGRHADRGQRGTSAPRAPCTSRPSRSPAPAARRARS